ncbi:uncharacterized protein LOC124421121, partial [Lucilia cuprina]|uniref:uncharacterized protein LOC124421121 n=1 Tax=Lucilia cuprina TaxID=7375 RepID=UPI001F06985B
MDFHQLYPKAECLHDNFETFCLKIDSVFADRIKDQSCKHLFQNMIQMDNISENGHCIGIFFLLHSLLVPSTKTFNVSNGKKICTRFTIRDSQRSFFIDGNTVAACEEELTKKYQTSLKIQPLILISGSILKPKEIVIYFEGIKYRMHSALNAIDICFKIFFVFNLEYPKESLLVWTFIQKHLYNISTNIDCSSTQ